MKHMRSVSLELIISEAYSKGNDNNNNNSSINNLKKNLRESLSSINMLKDDDIEDDFYKYC
jgi:hypothetical protein